MAAAVAAASKLEVAPWLERHGLAGYAGAFEQYGAAHVAGLFEVPAAHLGVNPPPGAGGGGDGGGSIGMCVADVARFNAALFDLARHGGSGDESGGGEGGDGGGGGGGSGGDDGEGELALAVGAAVNELTADFRQAEGGRRARKAAFSASRRAPTQNEIAAAVAAAPNYPEYVCPVVITKSDYAAQIETPRVFGATCASKEKHNCCITVAGYKPRRELRFTEKRGRRKAASEEVVVQECDTWFGFFDANHKANAQHYNMQRDDINSYLKYGYTVHGEWFLDGERLPRKGDAEHLNVLPAPGSKLPRSGDVENGIPVTLTEARRRDPDHPDLKADLAITDGCGGQVSGRQACRQAVNVEGRCHTKKCPCP